MPSTQVVSAAATGAARKRRVLVVGPENWTAEDLGLIREYLRERGISAKTFRDDEGLRLSDVVEEVPNVDAFLLVLSADTRSWCNRNSGRLSIAAQLAAVKFTSIGFVAPLLAAETAQSL